MSAEFFVGDKAPNSFAMVIAAGSSGVDLSTVTMGVIWVMKPNGTEVSWAGTLSAQSSSSVTVTYAFGSTTSPVDQEGVWRAYALLTLPSGTIHSPSETFTVRGEYT